MLQPFSDEYFMEKALQQANLAQQNDEIPIGAVITHANQVIARGYNFTEHLKDVTAHAEMQAITAAANYIGGKYLNNCVIYVTIEPCTMCAGALAWAQIGKIVYGADDKKNGFTNYKPLIKHPKTEIKSGVLAAKCQVILKDFLKKKRN